MQREIDHLNWPLQFAFSADIAPDRAKRTISVFHNSWAVTEWKAL
jgi:hypothetical protein